MIRILKLLTIALLFSEVAEIRGEIYDNEEQGGMCLDGDPNCICAVLKLLCKNGGMFCEKYREHCKCVQTTPSTTPNPDIDACWDECYVKCDGLDVGCELTDPELIKYCEGCIPDCIKLNISIGIISAAPPFWDDESFCSWCATDCWNGIPNCFQSSCDECESKCFATATTPDPIYEDCEKNCVPTCKNRDMSCIRDDNNYCYDCVPKCQARGFDVYLLFSDPPFGNDVAMCDWCESQCFTPNPYCNHGGCSLCDPDCRTKLTTYTTVSSTPDWIYQDCAEKCVPLCDHRDMSCSSDDNSYCYDCVPKCQARGFDVYLLFSDPPFGNDEAMCSWCESQCFVPNSCNHGGCHLCDPNCRSSTLTTYTTVSSTPDWTDQECAEKCVPLCDHRDMSCMRDDNSYCYDCVPQCQDLGFAVYYLFSDPPFGDDEAMCSWCESQCFTPNPYCNHVGCFHCDQDPDCRSKLTSSTSTTPSE